MLGGSRVVISRVVSPLIWVITILTLLITPLLTTHEPPSEGWHKCSFKQAVFYQILSESPGRKTGCSWKSSPCMIGFREARRAVVATAVVELIYRIHRSQTVKTNYSWGLKNCLYYLGGSLL